MQTLLPTRDNYVRGGDGSTQPLRRTLKKPVKRPSKHALLNPSLAPSEPRSMVKTCLFLGHWDTWWHILAKLFPSWHYVRRATI